MSRKIPMVLDAHNLPAVCRFKTTYTDSQILTTTAINLPQWIDYRANSLYDPDPVLGGAYANAFQTFMTANTATGTVQGLYNQFRVMAAKFTFTFTQSAAATGNETYICVHSGNLPFAGLATTYTPLQVAERKNSKLLITQVNQSPHGVQSATMYCDNAKLLGLTHAEYRANLGASGDAGHNPTLQTYCSYGIASQATSANLSMNALVRIKYYCELFNPVQIN